MREALGLLIVILVITCMAIPIIDWFRHPELTQIQILCKWYWIYIVTTMLGLIYVLIDDHLKSKK